jgi:hypothetical protein
VREYREWDKTYTHTYTHPLLTYSGQLFCPVLYIHIHTHTYTHTHTHTHTHTLLTYGGQLFRPVVFFFGGREGGGSHLYVYGCMGVWVMGLIGMCDIQREGFNRYIDRGEGGGSHQGVAVVTRAHDGEPIYILDVRIQVSRKVGWGERW